MYTRYYNGHFVDGGRILDMEELFVQNGRICPAPLDTSDVHCVNLRRQYLAPGLIDIQNNGVFGCNFLNLKDGELADAFHARMSMALQQYLQTGVTAMCPTVTLSSPQVYRTLLPMYRRTTSTTQTDSLGAHLEGPFISHAKKGCHPPEALQPAAGIQMVNSVYGGTDNNDDQDWLRNVCIVTAAPEIPGVMQLIHAFTSRGITFAIGHTEAHQSTARKAVDCGASMITHLYNAMPQPHHRDSGVVGLISDPAIACPYFGLICDGHHVDPSMAVLAYRANPQKCILTTDAMHLLGLPDGTYQWGNQAITKTGQVLYLKGTTTLAGAAATLPQCIRNMMQWLRMSLAEAVKLCTNNAAKSIHIEHERGFLSVGCIADFAVFDLDGYVLRVFKSNVEHPSCDINPRHGNKSLVALL